MEKITATTLSDVVAIAVHTLGFTPTASVFLALTQNGRMLASIRFDVLEDLEPELWAAQVTDYTRRVDADGVTLLSFEDGAAMTRRQYEALGDALARQGKPVRMAVRIRDGHIGHYEDGTETIPVTDVQTSTAALELQYRQDGPRLTPFDLPGVHDDDEAAEAFTRHAADAAARDIMEDDDLQHQFRETFAQLRDQYRNTTGQAGPGLAREAVLAALWFAAQCTNSDSRDFLMIVTTTDSTDPRVAAETVTGQRAPKSARELDELVEILHAALPHVPTAKRPGVLTVIGWCRFLMGHLTFAQAYLAAALKIDPDYTGAQLFLAAIEIGHFPEVPRQ